MTLAGSLSNYLEAAWTETSPPTADVYFTEDWFDNKKVMYPQIVVSDLYTQAHERFKTGVSLYLRMQPRFTVNVGVFIRRGSPGTQEAVYAENMRKEVARIMEAGYGDSPKYGGSLGALRLALPDGFGRRIHDVETDPRLLRYELELECTEDVE